MFVICFNVSSAFKFSSFMRFYWNIHSTLFPFTSGDCYNEQFSRYGINSVFPEYPLVISLYALIGSKFSLHRFSFSSLILVFCSFSQFFSRFLLVRFKFNVILCSPSVCLLTRDVSDGFGPLETHPRDARHSDNNNTRGKSALRKSTGAQKQSASAHTSASHRASASHFSLSFLGKTEYYTDRLLLSDVKNNQKKKHTGVYFNSPNAKSFEIIFRNHLQIAKLEKKPFD